MNHKLSCSTFRFSRPLKKTRIIHGPEENTGRSPCLALLWMSLPHRSVCDEGNVPPALSSMSATSPAWLLSTCDVTSVTEELNDFNKLQLQV